MKRERILHFSGAALICLLLTGCACSHEWRDATCTEPKTCVKCGEVTGVAAGHDWESATCTEPKTCDVCGKTRGDPLGHTWQEATCETPRTCALCGATDGEASGHQWQDATCTEPKTCSICGKTEGSADGHQWKDATLTAPSTCALCGATAPGSLALSTQWIVGEWETEACLVDDVLLPGSVVELSTRFLADGTGTATLDGDTYDMTWYFLAVEDNTAAYWMNIGTLSYALGYCVDTTSSLYQDLVFSLDDDIYVLLTKISTDT